MKMEMDLGGLHGTNGIESQLWLDRKPPYRRIPSTLQKPGDCVPTRLYSLASDFRSHLHHGSGICFRIACVHTFRLQGDGLRYTTPLRVGRSAFAHRS